MCKTCITSSAIRSTNLNVSLFVNTPAYNNAQMLAVFMFVSLIQIFQDFNTVLETLSHYTCLNILLLHFILFIIETLMV